MINLEKCKEEFIKYTKQFDLEAQNIKRKQGHSLRVMSISEKLAKLLNLTEEEIELATLIGLLHDIGRFEEYKNKRESKENKLDHADYGVYVLQKDDYIKKYIKDAQSIGIIYKAIKNHNKYEIEKEGLNEKELIFCKLIRDADKIDIFYEGEYIYWNNPKEIENVENSNISEYIREQILAQENVKIKGNERNDSIDRVLILLSFVYDINFKESFKIIDEEKYINQILKRFNIKNQETKNEVQKIQNILNKYVQKNM